MEISYDQFIDKRLKKYLPLMNAIAMHFGRYCEVVLHDLNKTESSLVAIAGNVTGRSVGAPITNFVLEVFQREGEQAEDKIGYYSRTKDGKTLKSSTIFIREDGMIIGVMCINFVIDEFMLVRTLIDDFCQDNEKQKSDMNSEMEYYANNVEEFVENIIEEIMQEEGRSLLYLNRQERVDLIRKLDEKGVFLVKGAVELIANRLGASKHTIYSYIDEARSLE